MNFKEYVMMALRDLKRRKGRTILTALGITIGTLLIVTMLSIGLGLTDFMSDSVNSTDNSKFIQIQPCKYIEDDENVDMTTFEEDSFKKLDDDLIEKLNETGKVETLLASIDAGASKVKINGKNYVGYVSCRGVNDSASLYSDSDIKSFREKEKDDSLQPIKKGRNFNNNSNEIVLGEKIILDLGLDPDEIINKELEITVDSDIEPLVKKFTVVGIQDVRFTEAPIMNMTAKNAAEIRGFSSMESDYFNSKGYDSIQLMTKEISDVEPVSEKIKNWDYQFISAIEMAKDIDSTLGSITTAFSVLGIIVLIVAALGIINTMSMAVMERTKSIGIMKAVGANRGAIKTIFLVQSTLIGLIGGLVGVIIATGINSIIETIAISYIKDEGVDLTISIGLPWYWVMLIIVFAMAIALVSGIYPASKASKLDPIEALRR